MVFEKFRECVDNLIVILNKSMGAYIDILDYYDPYEKSLNILWKEILTEEGFDWLGWYLYEKDGISGSPKKDMKAWVNGQEICKNLEDLHGYLTINCYFRRNEK
jgi:hypothetical protein